MPLASAASANAGAGQAPTYSWMQRSSQLTEFHTLKDSVKRLERSAREQLLLEQESQHAFEFLRGEIGRVKGAVGSLSGLVDDEFALLRTEIRALRDELRGAAEAGRAEAAATVAAAAEEQRREAALVSLGQSQLKETVTRIELEGRETRDRHLELSTAHASAVSRLEAGLEGAAARTGAQLDRLRERLDAAEGVGRAVKEELDGGLRREHVGLLEWAEQAKQQVSSLELGLDGVESTATAAREHAARLETSTSAADAAAAAELEKHREALRVLVGGVDSLRTEAAASASSLGEKLGAVELGVGECAAAQEALAVRLDETARPLRDSVQEAARRLDEQAEAAVTARLAATHLADRVLVSEGEVGELRQEVVNAGSVARSMRAATKDVSDSLSAHKATLKKAVADIDNRHEAYDLAIGTFAEALKIPNPVAVALSMAAAAV